MTSPMTHDPSMTDPTITAESSITELDATLSMLRQSWLDAQPAEKPRWWKLINQGLDERLLLMELRSKS
jgi:hypothetical protein